MPADIATTNGRTAMMYAGATPWHRLGKRLDAPATAAEAITAAGLDYSVELQSLKTEADLRVPRRETKGTFTFIYSLSGRPRPFCEAGRADAA